MAAARRPDSTVLCRLSRLCFLLASGLRADCVAGRQRRLLSRIEQLRILAE